MHISMILHFISGGVFCFVLLFSGWLNNWMMPICSVLCPPPDRWPTILAELHFIQALLSITENSPKGCRPCWLFTKARSKYLVAIIYSPYLLWLPMWIRYLVFNQANGDFYSGQPVDTHGSVGIFFFEYWRLSINGVIFKWLTHKALRHNFWACPLSVCDILLCLEDVLQSFHTRCVSNEKKWPCCPPTRMSRDLEIFSSFFWHCSHV